MKANCQIAKKLRDVVSDRVATRRKSLRPWMCLSRCQLSHSTLAKSAGRSTGVVGHDRW